MKLLPVLLAFTTALSAQASIFFSDPEVVVSAAFAPENINYEVTSGEKNKVFLSIENKSKKNSTISRVTGLFLNPVNDKPTHNTTTVRYGVRVLTGSNLTLPYSFLVPNILPGDRKLAITLEHIVDGKTYQVPAYEGIIRVVNPKISVFDFQMISTYLVTAAILGGLTYLIVSSFFPTLLKGKAQRKPAKSSVSAPVGPVTASTTTGYQEEWIPEHHKKTKKSKAATLSEAGATSASESESTSATKAAKRKGRK